MFILVDHQSGAIHLKLEEMVQDKRLYKSTGDMIIVNTELIQQIPIELKGKTLGCWCKPDPCHGDVLAELADKDIQ